LFVETASQTQPPVWMDRNSTGLYLGYDTIDGGGAAAAPVEGSLVAVSGQGVVAEYCWFKNSPSNVFDFGVSGVGGGGSISIRFNLIEDSARSSGGGGAYIVFNGGTYTDVQAVFNMSIQSPGGTGTPGWNMSPPQAGSSEIGNNVMVTTGKNAASYLTSFGPGSGAAVAHDNYFDLTGAFGFAYPGSGNYGAYSNSFQLTDGQKLSDQP
jgi:hypothetical protein